MIPSEEAMLALVGHRFLGGTYRIEHWENFLFSEATGIGPLPGRLAYPAHLFHVAINGVGTTITELLRLAESAPGAPVSLTTARGLQTRNARRPTEGRPTRSEA